ncbi:hypothetical protein [Rhodopseudomonas telluris]|uniref:DUF4446 family protein n=1 Tax=Rhodopseudomonas telluris TaxID=644215 RepID=A0ABV6EUD8_9BRAD
MEWSILVVLLVGAFFWWRHTKNIEAARVANERLDKDTRLLQHIKAGLRELERKRREEGLTFSKDGKLLLETPHMAAYKVSHFAESRTGFYFKDINEYGLHGFFAGEPGEYFDSYYRTDSTFKKEGRLVTRDED